MTRNKYLIVSLFLVALTLAVGTTYAQTSDGHRPAPSETGGSVGGPSMSGDAMNAGMPQGNAPDISAPEGNGEGRPQGGGGRPTGGSGVSRPEDGERPTGMTGFTPPSGEGSVSARFGERGSGNFQLDSFLPGEGESWFQFGGFGAHGEGDAPHQGNIEGAPWHTSGSVPEVPAAFSDLEAVTQAQANAQAAVDAAQGQATDAVNQATTQAQATYDQFWTDYYAAVDYTAQAYYDTVTASADYMLQTYDEAVNYATDSVDYYIAYAEQYASYCAAYPWDCYSYTYDASTNTYYYVGDSSDAPVSTVTIGDVTINVSYPVEAAPAPSAEAYEALVVFANDQLGAVVKPLYAGVATDSVQALMAYMPDEIEAYYLNSTSISAVTYWGLLNGGAAGVAVGDCSSGNCTVSQENLSLQLSSASGGAYGIFASTAVPTTPEAALALITQVYPKLDGLAFSQITDVEQGLAFTATTAGLGLDPTTGQPLSVAKVIYAGVVDVNGQPFVYALVAVGEGYVGLVAG